jgi:hypothetical protein
MHGGSSRKRRYRGRKERLVEEDMEINIHEAP